MSESVHPMTRAQKFQWYLEKGVVEALRRLPDDLSRHAVEELVARLEQRFAVLRTSIDDIDGELRQAVHLAGSALMVAEVADEGAARQWATALAEDLGSRRFGRPGECLVQFGLLRSGRQRWLVLVADNVAVDAGFHQVVEEAVDQLLTGTPPAGGGILRGLAGIQPAEAAVQEAGPAGLEERAAAAAYLRRHFATTPVRMHPSVPADPGGSSRYYRSTLVLPAADELFARVVSAAGVLPSAMILAAFAQLMCWRAGRSGCSVNVSVDNRHNADLRRVLGATAQRVPTALRAVDRSMIAAAAETEQVLAEDHPVRGRYDPLDLLAERAKAEHLRGACLSTDLAFNFVPPPQGWPALIAATNGTRSARPSTAHVTSTMTSERHYEYTASLSVRWPDPSSVRLSVHGDSAILPVPDCAAILRGIEFVITTAAAGGDCRPAEVATATGLRRYGELSGDSAGPRERRAIKNRLLAATGGLGVDLTTSRPGGSGRERMTARVTIEPGSGLTPFDLREELLPAVSSGEVRVVPDWYELVCAGALVRSGHGRAGNGRPPMDPVEEAVRQALIATGLASEPDLDLCYVRAGGDLSRYPAFAGKLRRLGFAAPDFAVVSGLTTLRLLGRQLGRHRDELTDSPAGRR